jgi:SAM-dependent methyltransferase
MTESLASRDQSHMQIVLDRYADRENIGVLQTDTDLLFQRYLSKAMTLEEIKGKRVLELGAGCSQYIPLFLNAGCSAYYGNDIIPERLAKTRVADPRYHEIPGDFLTITLPEPVDISFASLTMMCVKPYFPQFAARIYDSLKPGGMFLSMEANYFCPVNIYRNWKVKGANPVRAFSPYSYANIFRKAGFEIELMLPFSGPYPWTTGLWPVGTAFWMRARKPLEG